MLIRLAILVFSLSSCFASERIVALMITGKSPERRLLAELSIQSFLNQTYPNKHLLIINDGEESFNTTSSDLITEIKLPTRHSLGYLRNVALDTLEEDSVWIQWDDDDWHHHSVMEEQYKIFLDTRADMCIMNKQIQYASKLDAAWVKQGPLVGTPMGRKKKAIRYPELPREEDTIFWLDFKKKYKVVEWNNPAYYYIRFIHGNNTWDEGHFGLEHKTEGDWDLSKKNRDYLSSILPLYSECFR